MIRQCLFKEGGIEMRKSIVLIANEEIIKEKVVVENSIYNGFGKVASLPPAIEMRTVTRYFNAFELGDLFITIGDYLKSETSKIDNIELKSHFFEKPTGMGKSFRVEFAYDEIEEELENGTK